MPAPTMPITNLLDMQQAQWLRTLILALPATREGYSERFIWEYGFSNIVDPTGDCAITPCKAPTESLQLNGKNVDVVLAFERLLTRAASAMPVKPNAIAAYCCDENSPPELIHNANSVLCRAVLALTSQPTILVWRTDSDEEIAIPPGHLYLCAQPGALETEWIRPGQAGPIVFFYSVAPT